MHPRLPTRTLLDGRISRLWLLALTILLPGIALAGFGLRSLQHDRAALLQEARDRVDRAAAEAARRLQGELARWSKQRGAEDRARWPAATSPAADLDADAVFAPLLVRVDASSHVDAPPGRLLYQIVYSRADDAVDASLPPGFSAAESAELRSNDYARAAGLYEGLLAHAPPAVAPTIVHRLARTYAKAGRREAALSTFERLERMGDAAVGALPASLLGAYERCRLLTDGADRRGRGTCAMDLAADLVRGRWLLEKARYEHYANSTSAWLADANVNGGATREQADQIRAIEQRKRLLTEQVAELVGTLTVSASSPGTGHRAWTGPDGVWIAVRQGASPASFLILPAAFLRASVWPMLVDGLAADDLQLTVLGPDGSVAFRAGGAAAASDPEPRVESTRILPETGAPWRIRARGRGVDVVAASLVGRQRIYVGTLVLMVASLIIGTLLTARAVHHELQVAQLKSRFVAAVSHEFRTPLTSIRQLAELLDRGVPSADRQRQYFKVILQESERLSRLVENVLDFARMEDGRKQYRFDCVETATFIGDVLRDADHSLRPAGKHIVSSVTDNLPPIVADRQALAGALHNLIDNAAKYSPACDTIWVHAEPDGDGVLVRIRDGGMGIPHDEQPHVFDRFFRGRDVPPTVQGTGLGLSLVKHVVDAHGGSIHVESEPGEGTTVTVRLPAPTDRKT